MKQTRREFLQASATTALAAGIGANLSAGQGPPEPLWRNRQGGMRYRRLGRTGMMVSEIVMGGNEINPENYRHVLEAMDRGLNYLDTSPAYGRGQSELGFARVIRERPRDRFFLTSKVSLWDNNRNDLFQAIFEELPESDQTRYRRLAREDIERRGADDPNYFGTYFGSQVRELEAAALSNVMETDLGSRVDRPTHYRESIVASVEGSLKRLGTDHLDILMCPHGASSGHELTAFPEIFEAFDALKQTGKVRHLGVSSHSDPAGVLQAAVRSGVYSVAMVAYNILNHDFLAPVLEEAKAKDFGVIAMKVARPMHRGPGRGDVPEERLQRLHGLIPGPWSVPQKAYLWALNNPNLSAVISNMVNADQVRENLVLPGIRETA